MKKAGTKLTESKLFTETELELMIIIWKLGEASVSEVLEHLPKTRDLAYTSVSTILRILEQKKVLQTRKEGRGHIYIPLIKKSDYEVKTLKHVVNRVFEGTPIALVRQLLGTIELDENELREIKQLISKAGERK
jgi:predicted transcriptional regulator